MRGAFEETVKEREGSIAIFNARSQDVPEISPIHCFDELERHRKTCVQKLDATRLMNS